MTDRVLIVDDEDGVRLTFQEWLAGSGWPLTLFVASDAESALRLASEHSIDLAVLDWNLGSGSDGLQLLEDLIDFQPEMVAILVTGFANVATPLHALRMGVRDYLDKNQDLTRVTFLAAVRKQLDRLAPAKQQREVNRKLAEFREAVSQILPLVRGAAALNDPLPLPTTLQTLFRFLLGLCGASDAVLVVRHRPHNGPDLLTAYNAAGESIPVGDVPFSRTLAASVVSAGEACVMNQLASFADPAIELLPFEQARRSILAVPLPIGPGRQVVLELFDKPEFTPADRAIVAMATDLATEVLRQALAERRTRRLLFDAVTAALHAGDDVRASLEAHSTKPTTWLDQLRDGLADEESSVTDAETGLRLIESARTLAVRHGPRAVDHCITLIESLRGLLDQAHGE